MFAQEVVAHVEVILVRLGGRVDCQQNRTVVVLKNLDARIFKIRQKQTPYGPQGKCLLKAFCHRNVFGLTRGDTRDLQIPQNPSRGLPVLVFGGMRKSRYHPPGI